MKHLLAVAISIGVGLLIYGLMGFNPHESTYLAAGWIENDREVAIVGAVITVWASLEYYRW